MSFFGKKEDNIQKNNNMDSKEHKIINEGVGLGGLGDEGQEFLEALQHSESYDPNIDKFNNLLENRPELKFWRLLTRKALEMDVTDIHFEPEMLMYQNKNGENVNTGAIIIRFNINGEKIYFDTLSPIIYDKILKLVKDMYSMKADEALYQQNGSGEIKEEINGKIIKKRLRLSIIPTAYKYSDLDTPGLGNNAVENLVVRLLANKIYKLEDLGLLFYQDYLVSALQETGATLFTGPTSHGKTTTQVAALDFIRRINPTRKYYTVEDPVEIIVSGFMDSKSKLYIPGVTPIEKTSFLEKNMIQKHLLRGNPDVVVIGELTTAEDIEFSKNMSNTGHTVIGTMHTESTTEMRTRLESEKINYDSFIQVVKLIVSQRLLTIPFKTISIYDFKANFAKYKDNLVYKTFYNEWENILKDNVLGLLIRPNILGQQFYNIQKILKSQKEGFMSDANVKKLNKFYNLLKIYFQGNKEYKKQDKNVLQAIINFIEKNIYISDIMTDNEKEIVIKKQFEKEIKTLKEKGEKVDYSSFYPKLRNIKGRYPVLEFATLSDPLVKKYFTSKNITEKILNDSNINFLTIFQDMFLKSILFAKPGFSLDKKHISFDIMTDTVLKGLAKHDYGINPYLHG